MPPGVALLNYISCGILWRIFLPNWDNSRGFLIDNAGCVEMGGAGDNIFSAWFFLYIIRRKDLRSCDGQDGGLGLGT